MRNARIRQLAPYSTPSAKSSAIGRTSARPARPQACPPQVHGKCNGNAKRTQRSLYELGLVAWHGRRVLTAGINESSPNNRRHQFRRRPPTSVRLGRLPLGGDPSRFRTAPPLDFVACWQHSCLPHGAIPPQASAFASADTTFFEAATSVCATVDIRLPFHHPAPNTHLLPYQWRCL